MATRSAGVAPPPAEGEKAAPGRTGARTSRPDSSNRPVLGELPANAKLDVQPRTSSPLKRSAAVFDRDAKGFTYVKRRRLSHTNALSRRIVTPLSPPSSKPPGPEPDAYPDHDRDHDHDPDPDPDSGRESQNSNATRGSFSSLINYDPSSQQHSQHAHLHASPPLSIKSHVEMLRLRLRIALYKVRTNQIRVPFARLKLHVRPTPTRLPSHSPDPLPMAPPVRPTDRLSHANESHPPPPPPLLSTPNMYSNRFMPFHAPSSSPPLVQNPLSRIAREAQARMHADRDSLDSEATELAEDHDHDHDQDDHPVAESPLDRRHVMLSTGT